jgi:hypothetical protein
MTPEEKDAFEKVFKQYRKQRADELHEIAELLLRKDLISIHRRSIRLPASVKARSEPQVRVRQTRVAAIGVTRSLISASSWSRSAICDQERRYPILEQNALSHRARIPSDRGTATRTRL